LAADSRSISYGMTQHAVDIKTLTERINGILPQTQCGKCGFSGCRPYAEALARKEAAVNLCPPGGIEGIGELAALLEVEYTPFDEGVVLKGPSVAFIVEGDCIGCTLCIKACPVDAIAGASKLMHTVIAPLCTGCELCIPPCPMDCIRMLPLPEEEMTREEKRMRASAARERYDLQAARLEREKQEKAARLALRAQSMGVAPQD
jgi:Na+-translocating ferredoxin:NAD+ oxidoreductase subunit B